MLSLSGSGTQGLPLGIHGIHGASASRCYDKLLPDSLRRVGLLVCVRKLGTPPAPPVTSSFKAGRLRSLWLN